MIFVLLICQCVISFQWVWPHGEIAHAGIAQLLVEIEDLREADLTTRERLHQLFDTVAEHISEAGPKNRELVTELVHAISGDADERSDQVRRLQAAFGGVVEVGDGAGRLRPAPEGTQPTCASSKPTFPWKPTWKPCWNLP